MTAKLDGTNGLLQQYAYLAATTGFSYTFPAGTTSLIIDPAGTLATGTITMPAAPADGMTISFSSDQTITALTVSPNTGQSIIGNPTTMLAGGAATFVYRLSNTTWYAQASTAAIGSVVTTAAPVVTIYTSPSPWTKPATLKAVKVTIVAGGGGGGTNPTNSTNGGGGAAGYLFLQAPAIPGPLTVTVGTGGAGSYPTAGSGTPSSFGALATATGGAGAVTTTPGAGGTMATTPTIFASNGGTGANASALASGFGFGFGGFNAVGVGYGYGGRQFFPAAPGAAAGGSGIVVVEEFY